MLELVETEDADFAWMLGQSHGRPGRNLPPGGVDEANVLTIVRGMHRRLMEAHDRGAWMMINGQEVVGLCSYIRPPVSGSVEIGFGVAASRRRLGFATQAVAQMLDATAQDPLVESVTARTAISNIASQRVLEINGFHRVGIDFDDEDGQMYMWQRYL